MAEQDFEPSYTHDEDAFDVEITDLDTAEQATAETGRDSPDASPSPVPARASRSRSGLRRRWTMRQRLLQLMVTTMIVLLLLSIFVGNSASMRSVITGLFRPTPTPSPSGESDFFYVQGNPPWGQLFIDGHRIARLPLVGEPPLHLQRGMHVLRWQASPFEPVSCTISVPGYSADTCLIHAVPVNAKISAWLITFNVSLANLPASQRAALTQSVQATLDAMQSTDTVRPGELYAVASPGACRSVGPVRNCTATAQEPLRATLSFALDTQVSHNAQCISAGLSNGCFFQQQDCRLFCAFPAPLFHAPPAFSTGWNVFVVVRSSWTYALPDGQIIVRDQPDSFLDFEQGNEYFMAMQLRWNATGWQVAHEQLPFLSSPTCTEVENEVDMGDFLGDVALPFPLTWNFVANTTQSVGCLAVASATQQTNTTPPPSTYPLPGAYCLQRFGVLLAANATAHRYWPYLPLADSYEQNLAHQLAIQLAENL